MLIPRRDVVRNKCLSCFRPQQPRQSAVASGGITDGPDIRNMPLQSRGHKMADPMGVIQSPILAGLQRCLIRRVLQDGRPATFEKRLNLNSDVRSPTGSGLSVSFGRRNGSRMDSKKPPVLSRIEYTEHERVLRSGAPMIWLVRDNCLSVAQR